MNGGFFSRITLFTICTLGHTGRITLCVSTFRIFRPRDTGSRSQRITFAAKLIRVSFSLFKQRVRPALTLLDIQVSVLTP